MSICAIKTDKLGKQYFIGGNKERYKTLRESLSNTFTSPFHRARNLIRGQASGAAGLDETIWALKDVSFEVEHGEVVGIIGRNGAGKSTLLKVLARITEPTEGRVDIYGRVGSLLEVGTGFHFELTGRENIYLNGATIGMRRVEIDHKFDEIVDFAGVEKFIDTPVKHYSTGMYLRLAFAVAAHLEPHILLVDEVLSVGDAAFQRKCLGKMGNVAHQGRTVLLVSHNMAAVRMLCDRGIVLDHGRVSFIGNTDLAISQYQGISAQEEIPLPGRSVAFTNLRLKDITDGTIACQQPFKVASKIHLTESFPGFDLYCIIQDGDGGYVVVAHTDNKELAMRYKTGTFRLNITFPALWLKPGVYNLHLKLLGNTLSSGKARFISNNIILSVVDDIPPEMLLGRLTPDVKWTVTHS